MRILVTDGDSRAALAITRSLGAKGHVIFVACDKPSSLAGLSRYCHKQLIYPDTVDREEFITALHELVIANAIDILIPVTDVSLLPVIENRSKFAEICKLPFPENASLQRAANKEEVLTLARALDIPTPRSITVTTKHAIYNSLEAELEFPAVIKPSRSRVQGDAGWIFSGVDYADSKEELTQKLEALPTKVFPVLIQERIYGPGIGLFYCFDSGEPIATFAHRRLHEKPPSGGVSVLRESVAPHPQAKEYGRRLLQALNWHGVAMVEFKLDSKDNTPKLMEINGRFWGSLQLAIDAGVDFPDLLVKIACGQPVRELTNYDLGVRSRWFWGEVDLLLLYLLRSRDRLQLPKNHPSKLVSILSTINPYVRRQKFEVLRLSDIRPWLHESKSWFSKLRH